jgi:hypothetical protein
MDTLTIDLILSSNPVTKKIYQGCFPANLLPSCKNFPCALIVNADPANEPGSHWCAIFAPSKYIAYYFDSYGNIPNEYLNTYLYQNFEKVIRNRNSFQSIKSAVCGHYTIFVVYHLCLGLQFNQVLKLLTCLPNPDTTVYEYVNHIS